MMGCLPWQSRKKGLDWVVFVIAGLSKIEHQLTHRSIGKPEFRGDIFLRSSLDKYRPQGFVPSVIGVRWLREILLISRTIHESASVEMLVGVPDTGSRIIPARENPRGVETSRNTEKSAKKTTFEPNCGSKIPIL